MRSGKSVTQLQSRLISTQQQSSLNFGQVTYNRNQERLAPYISGWEIITIERIQLVAKHV